MVNARIKIIYAPHSGFFEEKVNEFLNKIDVRQIVSIRPDLINNYCLITYVDVDSYRDLKLDMLIR